MKSLLFFLFAVTLSAQPLVLGTIFHPSEGESLLLSSGSYAYAENDSGTTITLEHGDLRAKTISENLFITLPDGIATINGTVQITADTDSLWLFVFDGYMRFISSGGYPGETITKGYVRTLSRETSIGERYLNSSDFWEQFCDLSEAGKYDFGCVSPVREEIEEPEETEAPKTILLFHEPTWQDIPSSNYSSTQLITQIIKLLERDTLPISPQFSTSTNYAEVWEMERNDQPFRIIDLSIYIDNASSDEFLANVSLYQSETKLSNKSSFSGSFNSIFLSTESDNLPFIENLIDFLQKNIY